MTKHHALVTGAYGIVGLNLVEELATRPEWKTTGSGRSATAPLPAGIDYVAADLCNADETIAAFAHLSDATHLFFTAFRYAPDPYEEIRINVEMLTNTLDALKAAGAPLERVVIYQGGKAYGALLRPARTPAKETDPRVPGPLFYYDQEDLLYARGASDGFATTVFRPDYIAGIGLGSYTNLLHTVAAYGVVCKAMGHPMYFPGGPAGFDVLLQITDSRLMARATLWAADADRGNTLYNITNGDLFRWKNIWPRIAAFFDNEPGHPLNINLSLFMRDKGPLWSDLKRKHGLIYELDEIQDWSQAYIMNSESELHSSTIRIRQAGFHECLDTDDRIIELLHEMRERKYIP